MVALTGGTTNDTTGGTTNGTTGGTTNGTTDGTIYVVLFTLQIIER
jgi:hypothetical protein